jgi:glycosyltransferase involved in cell wall biosynthesis
MQVLICGNYGRDFQTIDGQTIKTRTLKDAVAAVLGESTVSTLDTSTVFRNPLSFYRSARKRFAKSTHVIFLLGRRALPVLLALFLRWKKKGGQDIRYVVIGGWLPDLLAKSRRLREQCLRIDGIYVETQSMADRLKADGFGNVHVLPNFRWFDRNMARSYAPAEAPLRLVFCARVVKEKGIEDAIASVNSLNANLGQPLVSLDVYGPVSESYRQRFEQLVAASVGTTYKGLLEMTELYRVLQQYDLLLFPTYYPGEGFPGTIVDAFIAGVPVLASDWKYNREIIDPGRTGAICRARSSEDMIERLRQYIGAPQLLAEMRKHCIDRAHEYHVDHALKELLLDVAESGRR